MNKNRHATGLSRLGASKGGKARALAMSPKRRSAVAKAAAKARWGEKTQIKKKSVSEIAKRRVVENSGLIRRLSDL